MGTDAENWMHGINCGRLTMEALQSHYDGDAEAEKFKQAAKSDLQMLFYCHEAAFSFEKYINRMKKCFDTLEKCQVPYYKEDKVNLLLDKIQNSHGEVKTQVSICRVSYSSTFVEGLTYMSREISRIFPLSNEQHMEKVSIAILIVIKNQRQNGKRLIAEKNYGIDISDMTHYYSKEEWKRLDANVRKKILDNPARKKLKMERGQQKRDISAVGAGGQAPIDSNSSVVTNSIDKESEDRIIAAVIRGVIESSRLNQDRNVGEVASRPSHGSCVGLEIGSVASSHRSRGSSVTFDQSMHFRP
jgi:hypothetical protein